MCKTSKWKYQNWRTISFWRGWKSNNCFPVTLIRHKNHHKNSNRWARRIHFDSILNYICYKELAHQHLFPTGRFGFNVQKDALSTPNKYFIQRLLIYSQQFPLRSDSSFLYMLCLQINIAMRKIASNSLTRGMSSKNF